MDGNVKGPAGSVANRVATYSGTTGKIITDSGVLINDVATIASVPGPATVAPLMDGTAVVGTTTKYAREDHKHPSDTAKADVSALPGAATVNPLMDGAVAVGTTTKYAREDHRHPVDTSREPTIAAGTTAQYWRGDKSWQTLPPGGAILSDTPPAGAQDNAFWLETDTGVLYSRWNDGNSTQWVAVPSNGAADAVRYGTVQTLTTAEQTQARKNVYAAPFDALAYSGMQVNGSMEVSQENGTTPVSASNANKYIVDGWALFTSGGQVAVGAPTAGIGPAGFRQAVQLRATTANAAPAAGHLATFSNYIEGYRMSRLAWGGASAQPITIGFWALATVAGLFSGSAQNSASTRSYVFTYTINTAATWEYKTVTIPGDTAGTWASDNTTGILLNFLLLSGSTYLSAPGSWSANNFCGATGTTNLLKNTTDYLLLTGVVVLPGTEAPSAARSPLIMRPYDQELVTCQRQYIKLFQIVATASSSGANAIWFPTRQMLRAVPTLLMTNTTYGGASAAAFDQARQDGARLTFTSSTVGAYVATDLIFDARL